MRAVGLTMLKLGLPALLIALFAVTTQPLAAAEIAATPTPAPANAGPIENEVSPSVARPPDFVRRHVAEFQQSVDEQRRMRRTMLGALTPAHRELLAALIGELAIAPDPDLQGAARRLDAALSAGEAQTVVRIERAREAEMLRRFEQMAADAPGPGFGSVRMSTSSAMLPNVHVSAPFGDDAASILLRTAAMSLMSPVISVLAPAPGLPLQLPPR